MSNLSIKRANILLGREFGNNNDNPPPTVWYMGLSIAPINKDGGGLREPLIDPATAAPYGYKRLVIENTKGSGGTWADASNGKISNAKLLEFLEFQKEIVVSGATGDLYATHYFLSTTPTGTAATDIEYMGELKIKRPLVRDSIVSLNVGDVIFEYDLT